MATRDYSEEDRTMSQSRDGERLLRNIHDTQTLLTAINETWSDNHDSLLGVLDLLDHKLEMIESSTRTLLENAEKGAGHERPSRSTL